ncbi:MAG TPA: alpha/beta hydrolase [Rhizobacter sp.]|nr:alpha/beta hydrolase [Rhizobacter sp.]
MPFTITVARALVAALPGPAAFHVMRLLAGRAPPRPQVSAAQQQALSQATRIGHGAGRVAWSWGNGPLVVLVHGWGGRAAQLAPLASGLSQRGYRCVAMDVTGHGESASSRSSWRSFIDDVSELPRHLGQPVHAFIGHSAGGLAMMAARAIHGLTARHYVCVCAPSHPFPPIRAIRQKLDPRLSLIERYQEFIAAQFDTSWRELAAGRAFAGAADELLLVYDPGDRFVDHSEGDRIFAMCPDASLVKLTAGGHTRVLVSSELEQAVRRFLDASYLASCHQPPPRACSSAAESA